MDTKAEARISNLLKEIQRLEFWGETELALAQWIEFHGIDLLTDIQKRSFMRSWAFAIENLEFHDYWNSRAEFLKNIENKNDGQLFEIFYYLEISHSVIRWIQELMNAKQLFNLLKNIEPGGLTWNATIRTQERNKILAEFEKLKADLDAIEVTA